MSKIEEVARAIGEAARKRHGGTLMAWAVSPERQDCLEFARAALAVMREPTEGMYLARPVTCPDRDVWRRWWEWQIDAALRDG